MVRRHSLLVRLLAMSAVVAGCSIAATAWLAAQSTSGAINQEIGEGLAADTTIYDTVLGHAATHRQWADVRPVVQQLAAQTGRRVTLTTQTRQPLVDSGGSPDQPLPKTPSAVVDPLAVDAVLKPTAATDGIDGRVVGPYRLTTAERDGLRTGADRQLSCLRLFGGNGSITERANGRPVVQVTTNASQGTPKPTKGGPEPSASPVTPGGPVQSALPVAVPSTRASSDAAPTDDDLARRCPANRTATATERKAGDELATLVNACLARQNAKPLRVDTTDWAWQDELRSAPDTPAEDKRCLDSGRREQLGPYVSPAALLFITRPDNGNAPTGLSTVGTARIAWTALGILALTIGITALAASRLVRPIHAVTSAARRMGDGDRSARAEVRARGEIGDLAAAFNAMSAQVERTERQRKTMVSDIAHELRTPLVNVRGWLEAAQDGVATLDQPLVSSLLEETLLLQHLIDDLQDLALADAGKLRLHPEPVHVGDLLEQVAAAHRGRARAGGVALTVTVRDEVDLTADPARLRQALGNLVTNALRYTPAGGRVTLWARPADDQVLIDVTDTGTGIGADELPHLFDRFWRAEKSRSRQGGGSGLGLAITRHLVEIHGGRITVRSAPGTGSTFTLHLPTRGRTNPTDVPD